jgi:hypothetical protein
MLPSVASSYTWFFYLGVFLLITHMSIYGFGLDLSYFGIFLMYIGWAKPSLHTWFLWVLWIFIFLDLYSTLKNFYNKYMAKRIIPIEM